MADSGSRRNWVTAYVVIPLLFVVAFASLLPLIETNVWWIRYLDFLRLQLAGALMLLLILHLALRPAGLLGWVGMAIAVLGLGYNFYRISPYMSIFGDKAVAVSACPDTSKLRVLVANLQKSNENASAFLRLVRRVQPDLVLALETDAFWDEQLGNLTDSYPHRERYTPENHAYYGMNLLSKYKLVSPQFRFLFDKYTPSIFTSVRLPDGTLVQFFGLHPRPPQSWSQPTTMRDAHLLTAALEARNSTEPTIVAGDLNAAPWERVVRRTMRIGRLLDPRVGRGYYPTYVLQSPFLTWPLDQVLYQASFVLKSFEVLSDVGSDHIPLLVSLCHVSEVAVRQEPPALEDGDLLEAQTSIEAAKAAAEAQ